MNIVVGWSESNKQNKYLTTLVRFKIHPITKRHIDNNTIIIDIRMKKTAAPSTPPPVPIASISSSPSADHSHLHTNISNTIYMISVFMQRKQINIIISNNNRIHNDNTGSHIFIYLIAILQDEDV